MSESSQGQIVTFYSYKGGTGRTMALANVAWILASNGKRVLSVDWDLESPGLHKFFHPFLDESTVSATPGVIEIINDYESAALDSEPRDGDWHLEYAHVERHAVSLEWAFPDAANSTSSRLAARTVTIPPRSAPSTGTTSMTGLAAAGCSARCVMT